MKRLHNKVILLFKIIIIGILNFLFTTVSEAEGNSISSYYPVNSNIAKSTYYNSYDFYKDLAIYWAPAIYQDTEKDDNHGDSYLGDYITRFDYDGNWKGMDNWDNLFNYPLYAYIYYEVSETETHYFIHYGIFHPRDWCDWPGCCGAGDEHENDFEGLLLVIRKDGTTYGSLHLMETQAHGQFYEFTNDPDIYSGTDDIDGDIYCDSNADGIPAFCEGSNNTKPVVYVQPKGHGPCSWDSDGILCNHRPGTILGKALEPIEEGKGEILVLLSLQ